MNEPVRKLNEGEFDVRLDQNFSNNDYAFARFSYDQATSYVPGGSPGFAEANPFGSNQGILNHARNVAASETHVFSPNYGQSNQRRVTTASSITFRRRARAVVIRKPSGFLGPIWGA